MSVGLPGARQPIAQANGLPDTVWFRFFADLASQSNSAASRDGVAMLADVVAASDADALIVAQAFAPNQVSAGATFSGRIIGLTSNGSAGTLNLWLSVNGVKVFTQSFTTPDIPGADKGFTANFDWTVRTQGASGTLQCAGELILALNYPTVLPSAATAKSAIDTTQAVTFALGMHWSATDAANVATVKIGTLRRTV